MVNCKTYIDFISVNYRLLKSIRRFRYMYHSSMYKYITELIY